MDSRSFIVGVACGALVGVAAGWILVSSEDEVVAVKAEPEPIGAPVPNLKPAESTAPKQSKREATVSEYGAPETSTAGGNAVDGPVPWPANQWQELELEPKDGSWAYYMEQTLLQFLGSHPSTAQFDVSRIECRTTMCQLEVVGYDASTEPVWQQVMYDIRQQPWSDFGKYGTSSGNVDGSLVLLGTLWRLPKQD
ncbi:MAG: hypothetical protein ACREQZ_06680 [Woeseiaceae bacterium]